MKTYTLLGPKAIRDAIEATCKANHVPYLIDDIEWKWSLRITQTTAQTNLRTLTIQLGAQVLARLPPRKQREIVARETCAIIGWEIYGVTSRTKTWKALMAKAGYPDAEPLMPLTFKIVKRAKASGTAKSPFLFECSCRKNFRLSVTKAKRLALRQGSDKCQRCGKAIALVRDESVGKPVPLV